MRDPVLTPAPLFPPNQASNNHRWLSMSLPSPLHQRLNAAKLDHPPGDWPTGVCPGRAVKIEATLGFRNWKSMVKEDDSVAFGAKLAYFQRKTLSFRECNNYWWGFIEHLAKRHKNSSATENKYQAIFGEGFDWHPTITTCFEKKQTWGNPWGWSLDTFCPVIDIFWVFHTTKMNTVCTKKIQPIVEVDIAKK